jgi:hypothetical protein
MIDRRDSRRTVVPASLCLDFGPIKVLGIEPFDSVFKPVDSKMIALSFGTRGAQPRSLKNPAA